MKVKLGWCSEVISPAKVLEVLAQEFKVLPGELTWSRSGLGDSINEIFIQVSEASSGRPLLFVDRITKITEGFRGHFVAIGSPRIVFEEGDSLDSAKKFIDMLFSDRLSYRRWVKSVAGDLKKTRSLFASKQVGNIRKTLEASF